MSQLEVLLSPFILPYVCLCLDATSIVCVFVLVTMSSQLDDWDVGTGMLSIIQAYRVEGGQINNA